VTSINVTGRHDVLILDVIYQCELLPEPDTELTDDSVESIIEKVADELDTLGLDSAVISGSIATRRFTIDLTVTGLGFGEIATRVDSSVRAAFHAAGVATPEWDQHNHVRVIARMERSSVRIQAPESQNIDAPLEFA
jgi:hypothetical protein